jgi:hypothetical protein
MMEYILSYGGPAEHWGPLPVTRLARRKILIEQNIKNRTGPALCVLCDVNILKSLTLSLSYSDLFIIIFSSLFNLPSLLFKNNCFFILWFKQNLNVNAFVSAVFFVYAKEKTHFFQTNSY